MGRWWTRSLYWLLEIRLHGTVGGFSLIPCGTTWAKNQCFIYCGNKDIIIKWLNDKIIIAFRRVRIVHVWNSFDEL